MNYVFFGTPDFSSAILEKLIAAGLKPTALVCNPDRPQGRKKIVTPPPTKIVAERHGIKTYQPEKLSVEEFGSAVGPADFAVVAAYAKIIPKGVIALFPKGVLGVHPSLLPAYRGASPVQSVILNGEKKTGVTIYLLDDKVDHGPIVAKKELAVEPAENYDSLRRKLTELSARLIVETLPGFQTGRIEPKSQNEFEATYTKKFETADARVDLEKDGPVEIDRKVRALNPEPGAWTIKDGKRLKILETEIREGKLVLKKIQWEGGKPQTL